MTNLRNYLVYILFAALFLLTIFSYHFKLTPVLTWVLLFGTILVPGYSLSRIFRLEPDDTNGKIVLWIGLGWLFTLGISFIAILLGLTIGVLVWAFLILVSTLLITAFILDLKRPKVALAKIDFRSWLSWNNLPVLLILIYLVSIIVRLTLGGSIYKGGDAIYHLATLRKVIENQPLTVMNLSYVKDSVLVAYGFPVWHVVMGLMTKIAHTNMFLFWSELCTPLFAMSLFIWYWLFRKILPTRNTAILALFFYTAFNFNWKIGYTLTTLPIPHSLTQFLLLPLLAVLALDYIFKKKNDWIYLIFITLLAILVGAVHLTAYFYFVTIMVGFLLFYAALKFREPDYKEIIKKTLMVIFSSIILLLPFALALELKSHALSRSFQAFSAENYPTDLRFDNFDAMDILVKYAYLALPLVFILSRKYRHFVFILGLFIMLPLMVNPIAAPFLTKIFSLVFMKRLYATIVWYFPVWAIVFGFVLYLIGKPFAKLSKVWLAIINGFFLILSVVLIWLQFKTEFASKIYTTITADNVSNWLGDHVYWILIPLALIGIFIYFYQKNRAKMSEIFQIEDHQNLGGLTLCFFVLIFLVFCSPAQSKLTSAFTTSHLRNLIKPTTNSIEKNAASYIGGQSTIDFIKKNIPPKSVFDTHQGFFYLPELVDVHMSNYSNDADLTYSRFYDESWPLATKLRLIKERHIEYLLVIDKDKQLQVIEAILDRNPEYFEKIFQNKAIIYKINQENLVKANLD